jgi:hypothetical protein
MLTQATEYLIAAARDASSSEADFKTAVQAFCDAVGCSSLEETNEALATLAGLFDLENLSRAGFLALLCGAYVERGCDPLAIARPLTERLHTLLESAVLLTETCLAQMAMSPDEDQDRADVFESVRRRVASTMPQHSAAWDALTQFWPPAIAVFSASAKARIAAHGQRDLAAKIADNHEAGHWLRLMLSVLDDEPFLVIEPATKLGIFARISGVVDNFQLNVLLMDGFPSSDPAAGRRVSQRVADVARGIGPQRTEDGVRGVWNLYTWKAVVAGGNLPDPRDYGAKDCWIWNEGIPEDIPVFEGRRVVLLGPTSYVRTWQSQRMFARLPATLNLERKLTKGEVADWLQRMVVARNAG